VSVIVGAVNSKSRTTGNSPTTFPPTYAEPSAPPMTSSSDRDVTRHVTCGVPGETACSETPVCRRCGAVMVLPPGDVRVGLPPPSYELSQQLQMANTLT